MDDVWLSSFTANPITDNEPSRVTASPALLQQQSSSGTADAGRLATSGNVNSDIKPRPAYPDPPKPTHSRRPASFQAGRPADRSDVTYGHDRPPRRRSSHGDHDGHVNPYSLDISLQYHAWLHDKEDELLERSHEKYIMYQDELTIAQGCLDSLLESTSAALGLLSSLSESFNTVEAQNSSFKAQCQNLLTEQKRITRLADDVKEHLKYYEYLEPITRRLNAPGSGSLVRGKDFPEMLSNLDACLDYMHAHPQQREAGTYQSKYRLLLTRALTLIRVHFTESLRGLAADVSKQMTDEGQNNATLLYARFRVIAPELKELGLEIQKRCVLPADAADEGREPEYQSLMDELYQSYTATRGRLLLPMVIKRMADIAAAEGPKNDLVVFAREAMGYIRGICLDEYNLWGEWFIGDGGVYEFLESICEPLYDHFRPRTIHETKLTKLCELCSFIQTRYMQSEEDAYEDDASDGVAIGERANNSSGSELDFAVLAQPALADAQTRLVFLAQATLRDEIERFRPTKEDLDYPRKTGLVRGKAVPLSGHKNVGGAQTPTTPETPGGIGGGNIFETHLKAALDSQSWYPTLVKAVRLLSRIYRLVNSSVFDDLAHRIVFSTTQSLVSAAAQIRTNVTETDADLFLVSQLLGLKQQIVAFDIEYVTTEVSFDFSTVTNTFYELRERGGLWNPATWYKLASGGLLPRVVENMLDAKADLDGRLRTAINELVNSHASKISAPLFELRADGKDESKRNTDPRRATTAVRGLAEKVVVSMRQKLDEYITDVRTKETLVAAVRDQVVLAYEEWIDNYDNDHEGGKIGRVKRKGKGREDEVWGSEVFADWCEKTFGPNRPTSAHSHE